MNYPEPIAKLIESYMKLPGIGQKTATRLAFYTIDMKEEDANAFAKALISVKRDLHFCSICGNITEEDPCEICQDKNRDRSIILVVEEPKDVMAMEKMREDMITLSMAIAGKIVAKNMDSQVNVDLAKEAIEKLDSKALG